MKKAELTTAAISALMGIYLIVTSYTTYAYMQGTTPGPGFLPRYVGWGMIVTAILYYLLIRRQPMGGDKEWFPTERDVRIRLLTILVGGLLLSWIINILGTFLSVVLFMASMGWFLGNRSPIKLVAVALGTALVVQFVFIEWLMVPLPNGILGIF